VLAFTATPLNREAGDFWGMMELLGADHFDEVSVEAVDVIRRAPNLDEVEEHIELVRGAFQSCLVRRTRSELIDRAKRDPERYARPNLRAAGYPTMSSEWYPLPIV